MNRLVLPLIAMVGFAAGWSLTSSSAPPLAASDQHSGESTRRELRKGAMSELLLSDYDRNTHRIRTAPLGEILAMRRDFTDRDISRIVDLDPAAAMNELLSDPLSVSSHAMKVAEEWARRQPEEALRYLSTKKSFRADDCLAAVLPAAFLSHPQQVREILRSKPKSWQEHYLDLLFNNTHRVRKPGAPQLNPDDPLLKRNDGYWAEVRFGADLFDCLADDDLRAKAKAFWDEPVEDEGPPLVTAESPSEEPVTWAPETYDPENYRQREALGRDLRERTDETIARIAANGGHGARLEAIQFLAWSSYRPFELTKALEKLEASMELLGAIPEHPPRESDGLYLTPKIVAPWIARQPLGLRRAWAPTFVETWAQSDSQAAIEWAQALPEEANRDQAFQTGMIVWTHQDPLAASHHVEGLPPGELREAAISNAAATWDCIDPAAAREWVAALPDSPGKQRAIERLKR